MLGSNTFLGIDIGTNTIKVVEMERGKNAPVLLNYAISPIPGIEALDDQKLSEKNDKTFNILKSILKEKKMKAATAAISISNRTVFTRFVKMPFSDPKKLERLVHFEAQQQIPFPLEDVSWDYQIVGRNQELEFEILIAAIKNELLEQQYESFNRISVEPVIFDVGSLSTYNALFNGHIKPEEKVIILDIGFSPTTMIIHQPEGYWVRTLSFSSYAITQTLMQEFNISYEEAESLKYKGFIISDSMATKNEEDVNYKINSIITQHVKKLYMEITRSLSFYKTQFSDIEIDRIILCGGGCRLDDLKLYLSSKFKVSVDYAYPIQSIELSKNMNIHDFQEVSYLFCEAIGLALRGIQPCKVELNLLAVSSHIETSVKKYLKYGYLLCMILILSFGLSGYSFMNKLKMLESQKNELLNRHESTKSLKENIEKEKQKTGVLVKEMGLIKTISDGRWKWMRSYLDLVKIISKEIYLDSFQIGIGKPDSENTGWNAVYNDILISGNAENIKALDAFKAALNSCGSFSEIEVVKASFNQEKIDFELRLKLKI